MSIPSLMTLKLQTYTFIGQLINVETTTSWLSQARLECVEVDLCKS
ncbi:hypothetical protein PPTG_20694 [Phytophthora nicotianae INRA-310]|uniref:Uncharacterized protein n=1 Tax=Phytophthora nicotianae (strain INRA-310) TaxID=761204 RepID=W2REQ5_PHYN3|nr:hypothetical protein PPTG_20694 [Phytophthora nicotianae INRA-310]ETN23721.1 hypothetical protein PPTG_20694 [Phytophthora nicotianae INRA-310]